MVPLVDTPLGIVLENASLSSEIIDVVNLKGACHLILRPLVTKAFCSVQGAEQNVESTAYRLPRPEAGVLE